MQRDIIVEMVFGSHLYGTNTEDSDLDIKGVYLPSFGDIALGEIKKSIVENTNTDNGGKNSKDDVDKEFYSLQYFLKLACQGQTVALDMLHAPDNMIIKTSPTWEAIVRKRDLFYTKNLDSFVGYARTQAAKYGLKGSRLSAAKSVLDVLEAGGKNVRLECLWHKLPVGEHTEMLGENENGINEFKVCGRILQSRMRVEHAYNCVKKYYDSYGARAELAKKNEGVDFKAISHAFRAAIQVKELLEFKTITFPLKEARFLKDVKAGKLHYAKELSPLLEDMMDEITELSKESTFPDKADTRFWDSFILKTYTAKT